MVIVDDGSTDGTGEIAADFAACDPRIRVIRQPHAGVSAARNRGLAALDADFIMFLDGDDWLAPEAFALLDRALQAEPDAVAAYGRYAFVAEDAGPGCVPLSVRRGRLPCGDLLPRLLTRNLFANGGQLLIRASALASTAPFRTDLAFGEDWECWIRLAQKGPFAAHGGASPLLYVRERQGSTYLRMAADPEAASLCLDAIFSQPGLRARLGQDGCAAARDSAQADTAWVVGRELLRHQRRREGLPWLARSLYRAPSPRRSVLFLLACLQPWLAAGHRGPFRPYAR